MHDAAGWSIFAFTALGLVMIAWLVNRFEKRAEKSRAGFQPASA
jgi:hypothetical protein